MRLSTAAHFQSENTSGGRYQSESTCDTFRAENVPGDGWCLAETIEHSSGRTPTAALLATPTTLDGLRINPTSGLAPPMSGDLRMLPTF